MDKAQDKARIKAAIAQATPGELEGMRCAKSRLGKKRPSNQSRTRVREGHRGTAAQGRYVDGCMHVRPGGDLAALRAA